MDREKLREIREGREVRQPEKDSWVAWSGWVTRRQDAILDALLAPSPPDGAAEREADTYEHLVAISEARGNQRHPADVLGRASAWAEGFRVAYAEQRRQPTPAPGEAQAGDAAAEWEARGRDAADRWWDETTEGARDELSPYDVFVLGHLSARPLARPAAVTEAMREAACQTHYGSSWAKWGEGERDALRRSMAIVLTAALAAGAAP